MQILQLRHHPTNPWAVWQSLPVFRAIEIPNHCQESMRELLKEYTCHDCECFRWNCNTAESMRDGTKQRWSVGCHIPSDSGLGHRSRRNTNNLTSSLRKFVSTDKWNLKGSNDSALHTPSMPPSVKVFQWESMRYPNQGESFSLPSSYHLKD